MPMSPAGKPSVVLLLTCVMPDIPDTSNSTKGEFMNGNVWSKYMDQNVFDFDKGREIRFPQTGFCLRNT